MADVVNSRLIAPTSPGATGVGPAQSAAEAASTTTSGRLGERSVAAQTPAALPVGAPSRVQSATLAAQSSAAKPAGALASFAALFDRMGAALRSLFTRQAQVQPAAGPRVQSARASQGAAGATPTQAALQRQPQQAQAAQQRAPGAAGKGGAPSGMERLRNAANPAPVRQVPSPAGDAPGEVTNEHPLAANAQPSSTQAMFAALRSGDPQQMQMFRDALMAQSPADVAAVLAKGPDQFERIGSIVNARNPDGSRVFSAQDLGRLTAGQFEVEMPGQTPGPGFFRGNEMPSILLLTAVTKSLDGERIGQLSAEIAQVVGRQVANNPDERDPYALLEPAARECMAVFQQHSQNPAPELQAFLGLVRQGLEQSLEQHHPDRHGLEGSASRSPQALLAAMVMLRAVQPSIMEQTDAATTLRPDARGRWVRSEQDTRMSSLSTQIAGVLQQVVGHGQPFQAGNGRVGQQQRIDAYNVVTADGSLGALLSHLVPVEPAAGQAQAAGPSVTSPVTPPVMAPVTPPGTGAAPQAAVGTPRDPDAARAAVYTDMQETLAQAIAAGVPAQDLTGNIDIALRDGVISADQAQALKLRITPDASPASPQAVKAEPTLSAPFQPLTGLQFMYRDQHVSALGSIYQERARATAPDVIFTAPVSNLEGASLAEIFRGAAFEQHFGNDFKMAIPIHSGAQEAGHWTGVFVSVDTTGKTVDILGVDSLGGERPMPPGIREALQELFSDPVFFEGFNVNFGVTEPAYRQGSTLSCGPCTLENLLHLATDAATPDAGQATDMTALRLRQAQLLQEAAA